MAVCLSHQLHLFSASGCKLAEPKHAQLVIASSNKLLIATLRLGHCVTCQPACIQPSCSFSAEQTPLEATLTEEEARRNSKRLELLYVSSSNPMTPDIFQLADRYRGADEAGRAETSAPMNTELTGTLLACCCCCCW